MKIALCFVTLAVLIMFGIALGNAGHLGDANAVFGAVLIVVVSFTIYFLPAIVAAQRGHRHIMAIFVTNLFLGWTFIGWVAALVWSCMNTLKPVQV